MYVVKPVFSDHIKKTCFRLLRQVVVYCFMKVAQKAHVWVDGRLKTGLTALSNSPPLYFVKYILTTIVNHTRK